MVRYLLLAVVAVTSFGAVSLDLSSPKSAAKSVYLAVDSQDVDAICQVMDIQKEDQQPLVRAVAELLATSRKLGDVAKAKFGDAAERLGSAAIVPEDIKQIDAAKVKEEGDTATVTIENQLAPMIFHKRADGWKLDISDYFKAHENSAAQTQLLKNFTEQLRLLIEDLSAGKFSTPVELETAIQQRFNEVMIKSVSPSTQPAK